MPREEHQHGADDHVEVGRVALAGDADVHPPDARDQGEREHDDADRGEHAEDVVDSVGDVGLVGVLEALDHLLVVLEHVPDPLVGVADVVEVDLELAALRREEGLLELLEVAQDRPLRADHLAEVDDLLLGVGDVAHDVL